MPDLPDSSFYIDGQAAVTDYAVECLNLLDGSANRRYLYVSDDIGEDGSDNEHVDPDNQPVGGISHTGHTKGSITIQLDAADDPVPSPGHILLLREKYYRVSGRVPPARQKNQVIRTAVPVTLLVNPVLPELLSDAGQVKEVDWTENVAIDAINLVPKSNRSGGTFAYAVSDGALPTGVTVHASSGVISGTPTLVGDFEATITVTETLTGKKTRYGIGSLIGNVAAE